MSTPRLSPTTSAARRGRLRRAVSALWAVLILSWVWVLPATAQTQLTYQGEIQIQDVPAEGELDFRFQLFNAPVGGAAVGPQIQLEAVEVSSGLFTVPLDFGDVFDGTPLFLEIQVKETSDLGPFQVLSPRRSITSATTASFAMVGGDADTVDNVEAEQLTILDVELVGSILNIDEGGVVQSVDLAPLVDDVADNDTANELNTTLELNGTKLDLTDAGGTLTADLSSLQDGVTDADADPANETITAANLAGALLELIENGTVTNVTDVSALLNSGLTLDGTTLRVTDGNGTLSADLSSLLDGVTDADADPANELNTSLQLSGTDVELTDAGGTLTADLSTLSVADADADPANESATGLALVDGNDNLQWVEGNVTNTLSVTALQNNALAFDGTSVSVTDGGGTLSADLTSLGDDADADPANELNTGLSFDGVEVSVTDPDGTLTADLSTLSVADADANPVGELVTAAQIDGSELQIVESGVTNVVDVSALQNQSLTLVGTQIQVADGAGTLSANLTSLGDDADADPANELNTGAVLSGTDLEITDSGGTLSVDLSTFQDGNVDADNDPAGELVTATRLINTADDLEIVEGNLTNIVSVAALQNASLTLVGDELRLTDGGGTVTTDLSALGDDADADPANELNTAAALNVTELQITDSGGTLTAELGTIQDGNDDPDSDPANEQITGSLVNGNTELQLLEGNITNTIAVATLLNSGLTFDGTTVSLQDGQGTVSANLSVLEENNTSMVLNGTDLEITDSAGTLTVDLQGIDGVSDFDTDPANELLTNLALVGDSTLQLAETGNVLDVDLSTLLKSDPTPLYDNLGWVGSSEVKGTGPGSQAQKILEVVETSTSNRFEIDFNRIRPGTIITNLPFTIRESGFYYLTGNLTNTTNNGDGITIDQSDVTLDLMGYTLYGGRYSGIQSDDGIVILGSETNIQIRNGGVVGWNGDGINALNADFSIFKDLTVYLNQGDGLVGDFNNLMVRVTAHSNGIDGIEADDGSVFYHCTAGQNDDNGIQSSEGCVVMNSASFDNATDGIDVAAGSVVTGCSASDNGVFGFDVALGGQAIACVAYDNMSNGFDMASACILRDSIASLNSGHGARTFANSYVIANKFHENDLDGLRISSTDCHVQGNQVTDNDQVGIQVTSSGSLIIQNTSGGNVTNYNIISTSAYGPIIDVTSAGDISAVAGAEHPWANFVF